MGDFDNNIYWSIIENENIWILESVQSLEYLQHGAIVRLGEVVEAMKSFVFPQH